MRPYVERVVPLNEHHIPKLIALITFWCLGGFYPLIFWPHSYAVILNLYHSIKLYEHKKFPDKEKYKFDKHMYSNEVYAYIDKFAKFYNHKVKIYSLKPKTFENRSIKVIHLNMPEMDSSHPKKGTILVLSALKGCDWDSVSASIDLMHKLCEECPYKVPYLLEYDWYIIPIFNPDGYDFTLSKRDDPEDYNRASSQKNRQVYRIPKNINSCRGVYLDRNFGFHWGESKPSDYTDVCLNGYAGPYPFSERESRAMRRFIQSLYRRRKQAISMFLQIHGTTDKDNILYPWRYTGARIFNQPVLHAMAKRAAQKVNNLTGSEFKHYQSGKRDCPVSYRINKYLFNINFHLKLTKIKKFYTGDEIEEIVQEPQKQHNTPIASGVVADWLMGMYRVTYVFIIEPYMYIRNSTTMPDQQLFIQKSTTIVFSLLKQYNHIQNSASSSYSDTLLYFIVFVVFSFKIL